MDVQICSFEEIVKRAMVEFPEHTMLISIGDPDSEAPTLANRPKYILQLIFDDITPEDAVQRLQLPEKMSENIDELSETLKKYHTKLFTTQIAKRIVDFIKNRPDCKLIICQCQMGQSRSAALAAALLEYFYNKSNIVFENSKYSPNSFVYQTMLEALNKYI